MLRRRSFIAGLAAALAAPAIVRAEMLMPARTPLIWRPTHTVAVGFPNKVAPVGSRWTQESVAARSEWVVRENGVWELVKRPPPRPVGVEWQMIGRPMHMGAMISDDDGGTSWDVRYARPLAAGESMHGRALIFSGVGQTPLLIEEHAPEKGVISFEGDDQGEVARRLREFRQKKRWREAMLQQERHRARTDLIFEDDET